MVELTKPRKFVSAAKDYLKDREAHWASKTQDIHTNSLNHLEKFFSKTLLSEITAENISRYQAARKKEKASGRTINIEVSLVRLVMRKHKMWANIEDSVTMMKENKDIGRELSEDEAHRVLTAAKTSVSRSLYPAILISMHTGLRNKDLRLMRWHQVEGTITVGKSKTEGGEGRLVPLSKTAWRVMKERRSEFPDALPEHVVFPRESCGLMGTKGTFGGKVAPTRRSQTSPSDPGILP